MQFNYNGQSANEMFHGDEHLCWNKCKGDKYNNCTCDIEQQIIFDKMKDNFEAWLTTDEVSHNGILQLL